MELILQTIKERTSILTGYEVDPVPELHLEATVAHEVLQSDSGDDPSPGSG